MYIPSACGPLQHLLPLLSKLQLPRFACRAVAGLLVAMARSSGTETTAVQQAEEPQVVSMQPELLQAQVAEAASMQDAT